MRLVARFAESLAKGKDGIENWQIASQQNPTHLLSSSESAIATCTFLEVKSDKLAAPVEIINKKKKKRKRSSRSYVALQEKWEKIELSIIMIEIARESGNVEFFDIKQRSRCKERV